MDNKDFAKGVLVGALAGAMAGILLAPKSGEETRKELKDKFDEIKQKVVDELAKMEEFTRDAYDKVVSNVVGTYEVTKQLTPDEADQIKDILQDSFDKIQKVIAKNAKKE